MDREPQKKQKAMLKSKGGDAPCDVNDCCGGGGGARDGRIEFVHE